MTDKIKSAIDIMENEMPHCGKKLVYTEEERAEAYTLSIRSLSAWEEVLNELYKIADDFNDFGSLDYASGLEKAIDIINQHLAEIEE